MNWSELAPMEMRAVARSGRTAVAIWNRSGTASSCLAHRDGEQVALTSKNGQPLARYFPKSSRRSTTCAPAVSRSTANSSCPRARHCPSTRCSSASIPPRAGSRSWPRTTPALYLVFDLLREDGEAWTGRSLAERRAGLERFARGFPRGGGCDQSGDARARGRGGVVCANRGSLDGVVAKRLDLDYRSGKRDGGVKSNTFARPTASLPAFVMRPRVTTASAACSSDCTMRTACSTRSVFAAPSPLPNAWHCSSASGLSWAAAASQGTRRGKRPRAGVATPSAIARTSHWTRSSFWKSLSIK